jgi:hypothetical protein
MSKLSYESYYSYLCNQLYREKPVDIITFLKDDKYLGKVTKNLKAIYPGWLQVLKQIFFDDAKYIIVFTGSIGIGKTTIAIYCMAYVLYKLMCMKDVWSYFEKAESGRMAVSFFNLTKSLGSCKGFADLQNAIQRSPWFIQNGGYLSGNKDIVMNLPLFRYVLSSPYSKGFGVVGEHVITGMLDEVDSPNESIGQRKRVFDTYTATVRRFESRFVLEGESIGKLFLVSSKQDELSFLDVFINDMKDSKKVLIFDKSQWDILPKKNYSGITFPVMVGDEYNTPRILNESDDKNEWVENGFRVIDVPIEYKHDFESDIVGSLRDLGGISVRGTRKYKLFSNPKFIEFDDSKDDPIDLISLEVGLNDNIRWIDFLDITKIRVDLNIPRCIHLDIAISGDAMGLACSCIKGWKVMDVEKEDGLFSTEEVPIVETDFVLRVKARDRDRIPLASMRRFILDLKNLGMNIKLFTSDLLLASEDTLQTLRNSNIEAEYFSVDKNIQSYMDFRNLVLEKRWICHKHPWLFFEMKYIEHNRDKNKIDHPDKVQDIEFLENGEIREIVMDGSKDVLDAVVGSVYNSILKCKKRLDINSAKELIRKYDKKGNNIYNKKDWFVNKEKDLKVLVTEDEKRNAMLSLLRNMNNGRKK